MHSLPIPTPSLLMQIALRVEPDTCRDTLQIPYAPLSRLASCLGQRTVHAGTFEFAGPDR